MDPLGIVLVAALLFVAYKTNALAPLGIPASAQTNPQGAQPMVQLTAPSVNPLSVNQPVTGADTTRLGVTAAASVGTAAVSAPSSFAALGLSGAAAGAAIAGIGAVVAIGAALWLAHEQRVKQAKDENSAVNLGVTGLDADLRTVNQAYNARQLDPQSAIQLLNQIMQHYWALVTPHIQPGRNGCAGGNGCPPVTSSNPCSGSIGAACCVGCYNLVGQNEYASAQALGAANAVGGQGYYIGIKGAIVVISHGGGVSLMQKVFASKYGGRDREAYVLTWNQSSAA
jgi:hypothetical protein